MEIRRMREDEWGEVATLIHLSTNYWYEASGKSRIFQAGPDSALLFCQVYESLDPGCCLVAEDEETGLLVGSCFYHPRETHMSLGIMNAHPSWFGRGVAASLLRRIIALSEKQDLPLRLVSSAMNLDSYSLYTRYGFTPRALYQDMIFTVPENGIPEPETDGRVRNATLADVTAIRDLELDVNHISREQDYRCFIANELGVWHTSVYEDPDGGIQGFLASVAHPGSSMTGPGFARTEDQIAALLARELNARRGRTTVFLIPAEHSPLVQRMYAMGARNCELHVAQCRGDWTPPRGINMPTFMPETC